ncbi:MAG: 3-oxoacyl-ACP reductase FabG [Candidatus Gastranaerophilaceae bacterium]
MNKEILITGSSRGIGKATAQYLSGKGFDIVLHCSKNPERLKDLKNEISQKGVKCRSLAFDIKNREETKKVLQKDIEEHGVYYGTVLNAGIAEDAPLPAMEDFMWDNVLRTNLDGFYNVLKPICLPMIQARRGRIVVMSSISGLTGNRGQVNYSASKAGLIGAAKALAREVAKRKITVNCIAAGIIDTEMTQNIPDEIVNQIPMRRKGTPTEVAGLINYLLSDEAEYVTGQVISINGGLYI